MRARRCQASAARAARWTKVAAVHGDHNGRDVVAGLALERQLHEPVRDLLGCASPHEKAIIASSIAEVIDDAR